MGKYIQKKLIIHDENQIPVFLKKGEFDPNFIMSEFDSDTTVSIPFHEKLTDENIEEVIKLVLKHDNIEYS